MRSLNSRILFNPGKMLGQCVILGGMPPSLCPTGYGLANSGKEMVGKVGEYSPNLAHLNFAVAHGTI